MQQSRYRIGLLAVFIAAALVGGASRQQPLQLAGAPCLAPPWLHCPDKDCAPDRVINPGPVVEMKTRRTYILDYPCDLKPGRRSHLF